VDKKTKVGQLLLDKREDPSHDWPPLRKGVQADKRSANKFFLASLLQYQVKAYANWRHALAFAEETLGDPEDLWDTIAAFKREVWATRFRTYKLHRFPKAHERVWRIAGEIIRRYQGDARMIWDQQDPALALGRLEEMRVGPQISRMIVGALIDTGQIRGQGDVKADVHVCRVLGRVFKGRDFSPDEATVAARQMATNPWLLDYPLWRLGMNTCRPRDPSCGECYLQPTCTFYIQRGRA
jgi:endonuclease III